MASIAWQRCVVYGLRRLDDVPGNSDKMACDVAGAGDALRAPSSDAPAGILLEQLADEFEEDGNVDESERTVGEAATGKATTSNVSVTSHRQVKTSWDRGCGRRGKDSEVDVSPATDVSDERERRDLRPARSLFSMIPSELHWPISFPIWNDIEGSFSSYSYMRAICIWCGILLSEQFLVSKHMCVSMVSMEASIGNQLPANDVIIAL
uniref:Uncharacterized protein n=1 Tax=Oryza nivara TaxID=4536 RepID=A0A0E0HXN8_ORYNI